MSDKSSKPRFSRQALRGLALLVGAGLFLVAAAIAPFLWHLSLSSRLVESQEFLALLEAKARANPRQGAILTPQAAETIFIKGATSGLAAAELQRLMVDTAEKHGMVVERTRPLPADNREGVAALRMEVNASGSIEALRGYLHGIETGVPLIFVNQVHISAGPAVADGDISDNLSVRLEVEGYAWWGKAS